MLPTADLIWGPWFPLAVLFWGGPFQPAHCAKEGGDYSCDSRAPGALSSHPEVFGICVRELCDIPGGNWGLGMGLGEDKISFRLDLVCLAAKSSSLHLT